MRRRELLGLIHGAVATAATRALRAQTVASQVTVALAPLGPFQPTLLDEIERGLIAELHVAVVRAGPFELPRSAFYAPRRRYRAERLLDFLRPQMRAPATRVLGVTEVDISTTAHGVSDWGILGLGDLGGRACVISTWRCRRTARDAAQASFRMVTTCVHEVGHTLGLEHCPDTSCLMTDARGSVLTVDRTSGHLCARCRRRVGLDAAR